MPCGVVDNWLFLNVPHRGDRSTGRFGAHAHPAEETGGAQLRMHGHLGPLTPRLSSS